MSNTSGGAGGNGGAFAPSLSAMTVATGVPHTRRPYDVPTAQQHQLSLELMRQKVQEGYKDPRVKAKVAEILRAAGIDGRDRPTVRTITRALLQYVQSAVTYLPDPPRTEWVQSPIVTLCLAPGLCIRSGDCDDLTTVTACLTCSAGIPTSFVKADYQGFMGETPQSHVLLACRDENGRWFFADPSTKNDLEDAHDAARLTWVDPLTDAPVEIIGVGARGRVAPRALGRPWRLGLGDTSFDLTQGTATDLGASGASGASGATGASGSDNTVTLPGSWTAASGDSLTGGLRYAVGISGAPSSWASADVAKAFAADFMVEATIPGQQGSWVLTGIARKTETLSVPSSASGATIAAVLQESVTTAAGALVTGAPAVHANPPAAISAGTAIIWGVGVAAAAGLFWEAHRKGHILGR